MVQLNFFITAGFATLLASVSKVNALPGVGANLNDQQLYIVCPLEETGRGDTTTCCTKVKGAIPVGAGADANCQIPIEALVTDLTGVAEYLECCSGIDDQTQNAGGAVSPPPLGQIP